MRALILAATFVVAVFHPVLADEMFPLVKDPVVKKACAECHVLYPPEMLPTKSWQRIMDGLGDHFGDKVSLAPDAAKTVLSYHLTHASDVTSFKESKKFLLFVDPENPPIRVTEIPRYVQKHFNISMDVWKRKEVKFKGNCAACHPDTAKGDFGHSLDVFQYKMTDEDASTRNAIFGSATHPPTTDGLFPVVDDAVVNKECSECHIVFPPQMLPSKSWRAIMNGLSDHFGEDASLSPDVAKKVLDYHLTHASDVTSYKEAKKFLKHVDPANPPIRITEIPHYAHKHDRVSPEVWKNKKVGSKVNCIACHADTDKGHFARIVDALKYKWATD